MKRRTFIALTPLVFTNCGQVDKTILAMDAIIAAATVNSIIQSNNPQVLIFDNLVIDDANQTINLWTQNPHDSSLIGKLVGIWKNLLDKVNPNIGPIVSAIVQAIQAFISQLQSVPPTAIPRRAAINIPKLSKQDLKKIEDMREKLRVAKIQLSENPVMKGK